MDESCHTHTQVLPQTHIPWFILYVTGTDTCFHNSYCMSWNSAFARHLTHINASRVMSHVWMSHVTHMNESQHRYIFYKPFCMSDISPLHVMSHTYKCVTSHVTHINESWAQIHNSIIHISFFDVPPLHLWGAKAGHQKMKYELWYWHINMPRVTYEWVMAQIQIHIP